MRPWTKIFLYLGTLPSDLIMWLALLIVRAAWGKSIVWAHGCVVVHLAEGSWPVRTWYAKWGGTAIGHAVMLNGARPAENVLRTLHHELIHVEQSEANSLACVVLALGVLVWFSWPLALVVWLVMPWAIYGAAMLTAWLRGEDPYRGNHLEEAAYDGTSQHHH